ncbi:gluconokinase [Celeribacter sp. ULVN23_4]
MTDPKAPRRIVVMGVSGCGKSTVGEALAQALGYAYLEGDDFHPAENRKAMSEGRPLDDAMRAPWLDLIRNEMDRAAKGEGGVVASCSALKRAYRERLSRGQTVLFVHLVLSVEDAQARMQARTDHFMPTCLAESQALALEPLDPEELGLSFDARLPVAAIVSSVLAAMTSQAR